MYSVYLDYPNLLLPSKKLTMPSIGLFFFFLGLVVASVKANKTTTAPSTVNYTLNSITSVTRTTSTNNVTGTMNTTQGSSTSLPSTTMQHGGASSKSANETPSPVPTTKSNGLSKRTTTAKTNKDKNITANPDKSISDDRTGIIILVVIILVALGFGVACFLVRKRGRSYSVDHSSRQDEANIPLSTMDPELRIDAVSQNGLQTFESTEKDLHEPEAKPEVQEVQTAEAAKPVVDPGAESAAPAPTPDGSEDKPKEDVVEQSPPAPVTLSVEEKTDDEGVVSNQISVELLKEANENNSNNADFSQARDMKGIVNLRDVPLNCPV